MPTFNFNASDFRVAALTPGSYVMAIENIEETVSKTNKPMLKVTYSSVHPGFEGSKAWQYIVFPSGQFNLAQILLATGEYTEEELIGNSIDVEYPNLIGRRLCVVLTPSTYNGKATTSVSRVLAESEAEGPSGEKTPMSSNNSSGGLSGGLL